MTLTREQIMSMSAGRELDAMVAEKIMNWELGEYGADKWYYKKEGQIHGMAKFVKAWNPSTDIAAAWEVVEKMKIAIIPQSSSAPTDMSYLARYEDWPKDEIEVFAETAPLAIVKAALLTLVVDIEEE